MASAYRNRILYPSPAKFVVELSQSGTADQKTAQDPYSDTSPILYWNNSFCENTISNQITGLTLGSPLTPEHQGDPTTFSVTSSSGGALRAVNGFYVGAILASTATARRIIEYTYIGIVAGNSTALITVESAIPDTSVGGGSFQIVNPSPAPTNTTNATIFFFIPTSISVLKN